jgi:hypothetical protein
MYKLFSQVGWNLSVNDSFVSHSFPILCNERSRIEYKGVLLTANFVEIPSHPARSTLRLDLTQGDL